MKRKTHQAVSSKICYSSDVTTGNPVSPRESQLKVHGNRRPQISIKLFHSYKYVLKEKTKMVFKILKTVEHCMSGDPIKYPYPESL